MTNLRRWLPALLLAVPCPAVAQGVIVAPHAVFIDHATRSGSITLYNPGEQPVEVSISFTFGYPKTDSSGVVSIELTDTAPAGEPAATAWLQAFPRRVTIGQQKRQTIRILASPPANLPDGEYWARITVSAKGGKVPVAGVPDSGGITVGLSLEVRTVISVMYRKGALTTGVTMAPVSASYAGDSVAVRIPLTRTGTAAYLGTAQASVTSESGELKGKDERAVAVYYGLNPRIDVPVGALAPGKYKVRVSVSSDRADLPPKTALTAPTVRDSVELVVR
jgi:P pilus assembly chaperone PapD